MSLFMPPNRVSAVTSDVLKSGPGLWLDFQWWRGNEIYYDHRACWTTAPLVRQRHAIAVIVVCMAIGTTAVFYSYRSDASMCIEYRQIQKFGRKSYRTPIPGGGVSTSFRHVSSAFVPTGKEYGCPFCAGLGRLPDLALPWP